MHKIPFWDEGLLFRLIGLNINVASYVLKKKRYCKNRDKKLFVQPDESVVSFDNTLIKSREYQ